MLNTTQVKKRIPVFSFKINIREIMKYFNLPKLHDDV